MSRISAMTCGLVFIFMGAQLYLSKPTTWPLEPIDFWPKILGVPRCGIPDDQLPVFNVRSFDIPARAVLALLPIWADVGSGPTGSV